MTQTIDTPSRTQQATGFTVVSGVAAVANAVVLWLMLVLLDRAAVATVLAALVVAPPTLVAYQRVVWPASESNRWSQHLVFLANTGVNVLLAGLVAGLADRSGAGTALVFGAVISTYGVLAVARFALLDRVLFAVRQPT